MDNKSLAAKALEQGKGILRLAPTWVPRSFCVPGRRIKLHPDDYYVLGGVRGGIDERWLSKAQYDLLIGSFNRDEDRVAAFSQTAEANNVDLSTQLYAVLFALKAAEKCGDPRVNFSSYVNEAEFSARSEEEELARFQIEKMIENRLLFKKN